MKNALRKHRLSIMIVITLTVAFGLALTLQLEQYSKQMKYQRADLYQILGSGDEGMTMQEAVAALLKGQNKDQRSVVGQNILEQNGFDSSVVTELDRRWKHLRNNTIFQYLGLYLFVLTGLYFLFKDQKMKREREIEEIRKVLEQFHEGVYQPTLDTYGTGIVHKLNNTLETLSRSLKLKDEHIQRDKEETKALVTDISHQIKTPIASMKMCYALLTDEKLNRQEQQEFLERLRGEVDHLELLAGALVNISRMETGMITIKKENSSIAHTVAKAVNLVYVKAETRNITITLEESDTGEIDGLMLPHDAKWTSEAIANVIDNAIKYSPPHSIISIRMTKQINYLRIEIEDQGIGIPKEEYHQIFKRFYRGKSNEVSMTEGSGIGLYLSRKIIEEQGGSITVSSATDTENKVTGSIFVIQLRLS